MSAKPLTLNFREIHKKDLPVVGGKGANLGEMVNAGFPVPGGFAVTVHAYDIFLDESGIRDYIADQLKDMDRSNSDELHRVAKDIQRKIIKSEIPEVVAKETIKAYKKLSGRLKKALVAARSSATAEDLPDASFAGQQATFLNVKGEANLLEKVRECWASLFTARAIFYREENKIAHDEVKISVIVQRMIQSDVSGVMFTIDPVTNEKDRIVIEAVWGLGELIVQGSVVPDRYAVQKETYAILSKEISDQAVMLVKSGNDNKEKEVPKYKREKQKLTNEQIIKLAKIGQKIQEHYYFPQDIEWGREDGELYIVQSRPITTIDVIDKAKAELKEGHKVASAPILTGISASPGMASGPVKVVLTPKEINRVNPGDVLVSTMTSPDFVPAMKKASAIVTDHGGATSHAAIVSRELGIPCVVGTNEATQKLKESFTVTVNGSEGKIYLGAKVESKEEKEEKKKKTKKKRKKKTKTATNLYVNLAEPELAKEISKRHVDGVGLLRAEFMIADIGIHPKEAIKQKTQQKFIDKLTNGLEEFCSAFHPRPVVYRATDFKTNEYRQLKGGEKYEPEEPNPMLGYRGAFRYVNDPEVFNLELQAIKKVREKYDNLWIMIPFVRSPEELAKVRRVVAAEGLFESPSFKFWMMVELPVNVIKLSKFLEVGVDGVSVGSNDLTMLLLGTDRDNSEVAEAFDERRPVVSWALKRIVKTCQKHGVTASICGQAPSVYEDLVERLVKYGITSISVNPDAIERVREVIARTEHKIATK